MKLDIAAIPTLAIAIIVLMAGRFLIRRLRFFERYTLPEPVVGGLLAALVITGLRFGAGADITFDLSLQTPFMLAFFATVGLSADVRTLLKGGRSVVLFLIAVIGTLVLQNVIGMAAAMGMDLHPLTGLLAGSITMTGGHGTGAAYAARFSDVNNLHGAMEMAMACATFGLVLGGLVGGPVAQRLITRHGLQAGAAASDAQETGHRDGSPAALTEHAMLETMLLIALCIVTGTYLAPHVGSDSFALPAFVWTLFTGVILRNLLTLAGIWRVDDHAVGLLGNVALSLFLAMALMSLRLWELVSLALPILAILSLQTLAVVLYAYFITFRIMGRDYDAAVMAAGHCGIGLGATPTAIANMQAVTSRHGPSPQAFLIIPVVGAFLIDLVNALTIQAFISLPMLGF